MHTRNTTTQTGKKDLQRALISLETLSNPRNIPILQLLQKYSPLADYEIALRLGFDVAETEERLQDLCATQVVFFQKTGKMLHYSLHHTLLWRIYALSVKINKTTTGVSLTNGGEVGV